MALADHNANVVLACHFDEASGNALDSSGNSYDLTGSGSPGSTTGILGNCRTFNGSQYFERADNADLSSGYLPLSWLCWIYFTSKATDQVIFSKFSDDTPTNREYMLRYVQSTDRLEWFIIYISDSGGTRVAAAQEASTFGSPPLNTWMMVYTEYDHLTSGGRIGISVNAGTLDTDPAIGTWGMPDTATAFRVGGNVASGPSLTGRVDELVIWRNNLLTADERTAAYAGGAGLAYPFSGGGGGSGAARRRRLITGVGS